MFQKCYRTLQNFYRIEKKICSSMCQPQAEVDWEVFWWDIGRIETYMLNLKPIKRTLRQRLRTNFSYELLVGQSE